VTDQPIQLPNTATEARAALDTRMQNPDWAGKYLSGGANERREFDELTATIAKGGADVVAAAMAGAPLPDIPTSDQRNMVGAVEWLRELGIQDAAASQILRGDKVSAEEFQATKNWKAAAMADTGPDGFVAKYLAGDAEAKRKMALADGILTNGVKAAAA
jgi:hypothetical protein